jgi:hypothetical protein
LRKKQKPRRWRGFLILILNSTQQLLVLLVLLAALLLATLLARLILLLLAALLAAALLTALLAALLLLALLLVRILIHLSSSPRSGTPGRALRYQRDRRLLVPRGSWRGNPRLASWVGWPQRRGPTMGRYLLLWLLGVPIPLLILIWLLGGLH